MTSISDFLATHDAVVAVEIVWVRGSSPREAGAVMYVAPDAVAGTIGGGHLEYMAIDEARALLLGTDRHAAMDVPLGPEIGQCCGGRVDLRLAQMDGAMRQRAIEAEQVEHGARPHVYILGAGHVGRAIADMMQHVPLRAMLVDGRAEELGRSRAAVEKILTALPEAEVRAAPKGSAFIVLTHDHALDFLLAGEALGRGDAAYVGMIGSSTKRASFARWLRQQEDRDAGALVCPMGAGASGDKRPEMIAALVVAEVIRALADHAAMETVGPPQARQY